MKFFGWFVAAFLLVYLIIVKDKSDSFVAMEGIGSGSVYSLGYDSTVAFKISITDEGTVDFIRNKVDNHYQEIGFNDNGVMLVKGMIDSVRDWQGQVYYFFESGNLESIFNYVDGIKTGSAVRFHDSTDRFKEIMLYNDFGELYYRKTFDIKGNLIKTEGSK